MADVKLYLTEREERRRKYRRRARIGAAAIGAIALLGGALWFIFQSPFLIVGEIAVTGNHRVNVEEIRDALRGAFGRRSFVSRTMGLEHLLAWPVHETIDRPAFLPELERIEVIRDFSDRRIHVAVTEREPAGVWCLRRKEPVECFWFTRGGVLFSSAPEAEGSLLWMVSDHATEHIPIGSAALSVELMSRLVEAFEVLRESKLGIREVRYNDPALQEVRVATYEGPAIFFSLRFSPQYALPAIRSLLEDDRKGKLSPRFHDLEYVDFRIENRVYYR